MNFKCYVLDGRNVREFEDIMQWVEWMQEHPDYECHVGDTTIGEVRISTVCLTSNHRTFYASGPPVVFETALFKEGHGFVSVVDRYETYDAAEKGHKEWCDAVQVRFNENRLLGDGENGTE